MVFLTRYTDLLTTYYSAYNSCMKILYIVSTAYTVYLIRWKEPICSTYDREQDQLPHWKVVVAPSAVVATVLMYMYGGFGFITDDQEILWWAFRMSVQHLLWMFSIVLESGAILPQLMLLRRYRMIENLTANYVFFMGIYRLMYIFNWVHQAYNEPGYRHHLVVYIAAVLQVLFYVEFFYYYIKCKVTGMDVAFGSGGENEYHDCNIDGLRTDENSLPLVEHSDGAGLRMRGKQDDKDGSPLFVV